LVSARNLQTATDLSPMTHLLEMVVAHLERAKSGCRSWIQSRNCPVTAAYMAWADVMALGLVVEAANKLPRERRTASC